MRSNDPIWRILRDEGRHMGWLARRAGYSHKYARLIACGVHPASGRFRRRCAEAMNLPEAMLFCPRPPDDGNGRQPGNNNQSA